MKEIPVCQIWFYSEFQLKLTTASWLHFLSIFPSKKISNLTTLVERRVYIPQVYDIFSVYCLLTLSGANLISQTEVSKCFISKYGNAISQLLLTEITKENFIEKFWFNSKYSKTQSDESGAYPYILQVAH